MEEALGSGFQAAFCPELRPDWPRRWERSSIILMICSLLWGEALFRPSSLAVRSMNDEEAFFRPKELRTVKEWTHRYEVTRPPGRGGED